MVWTCHEERPRVYRKKSDENKVIGNEKKREVEDWISECSEGGYGGIWCEGEGHWNQDVVEKHYALWQPLIKGTGRKKKKKTKHRLTQSSLGFFQLFFTF